jgi:transcriptional regulator with XRE-family HTH domain
MLGKRLEDLMGKAGYTRKTFCRECGIAEATLCRYLNGERSPSVRKVDVMARALGVDPSFLLEERSDDPYAEVCRSVDRFGNLLTTQQRVEVVLGLINRDPDACNVLGTLLRKEEQDGQTGNDPQVG